MVVERVVCWKGFENCLIKKINGPVGSEAEAKYRFIQESEFSQNYDELWHTVFHPTYQL